MKKVKMHSGSNPVMSGETGIQAALRHKKMQEMKKEAEEAMMEAMAMRAVGRK